MITNRESEITKFKRHLIKRMYETPAIIWLLDCPQVDPQTPDTAEWTCIFPYIKIPDTQEQIGNFIGIKIDNYGGNKNNRLYDDLIVTVSVICSIPSLRVKGWKGIRTDIIAGEIKDLFNLNAEFGFKMELEAEGEGVFEDYNYYYRNLRFRALRSNTSKNCPAKE